MDCEEKVTNLDVLRKKFSFLAPSLTPACPFASFLACDDFAVNAL